MASSTTELLWGCETRYWCMTEGAVPATLSTAASRPGSSVVSDGTPAARLLACAQCSRGGADDVFGELTAVPRLAAPVQNLHVKLPLPGGLATVALPRPRRPVDR